MLIGFLHVIFVIAALLLILLVLFRPSDGSGLAGAFGGMGSDNVFGARATQLIDKIITGVAAVFIVVALAIGIIRSRETTQATDDSQSSVLPADLEQDEVAAEDGVSPVVVRYI